MRSGAALLIVGVALSGCAGRIPEVEHLTPESALVVGAAEGSSLRLHEDTRIEGVVFAAGTRVEVGPHLDVTRGTLAEDQELAGMTLPRGTEVRFEDGAPSAVLHPTEALTVRGLVGAPGVPIALHPDGSVEEICLARRATIDGLEFPAGTSLYLDDEGFAAVLDPPTYFPTGRFVSVVPSAHADCRPRESSPETDAMIERMLDAAAAQAERLERCRALVASGPPRPVVVTARLGAPGALDRVEAPPELDRTAASCIESALAGLALDGRSGDGFTVSILWYVGDCGSPAECHDSYVHALLEGP